MLFGWRHWGGAGATRRPMSRNLTIALRKVRFFKVGGMPAMSGDVGLMKVDVVRQFWGKLKILQLLLRG